MPIDNNDLTGTTPRRKPKADITQIGGHALSPSTLMMGYGYDPMLSEGSLKPPVFLTSTRSEEHTSELQSLMRISYAVFCLKKKKKNNIRPITDRSKTNTCTHNHEHNSRYLNNPSNTVRT